VLHLPHAGELHELPPGGADRGDHGAGLAGGGVRAGHEVQAVLEQVVPLLVPEAARPVQDPADAGLGPLRFLEESLPQKPEGTWQIGEEAYNAILKDQYLLDYDAAASKTWTESIDRVSEFVRGRGLTLHYLIETHAHADHILGMDDMRRFCDLCGFAALPVYSTKEGLQRVQEIFPYAIRNAPVVKGYPAFRLAEMPECLETPGGVIECTLLPHGPLEVLGLVFTEKSSGKRFAYYTDCQEVPEEARKLAGRTDLLVLDGLRPEPHPTHMHIDKAVETSRQMDSKQTFLTHLTFMVDHDVIDSELPEGVNLAYDGLRIYL